MYGQDEGDDEQFVEDEYTGEGFSLQGASGFFNVLSPVLIRPGNILAGFSYRSEFGDQGSSAPPATIGYGLAKLSEVYVAFEPRSMTSGNEENEVLVGMKMLGFVFGDLSLGAGIVYRNVDVTADGIYAGRYMHYGAQLLVGYHFDVGLRLLGNAGYSISDSHGDFSSDYLSFGGGLSYPLQSSLLLITDVAGRMYSEGSNELAGTAGARYYAFEHVQVNAGLQLNRHDDRFHFGMLLGVGFSSEILRTSIEGEESGEYFPELPSLDALDAGATDASETESGSVPALPALEEMGKDVESSDNVQETGEEEPVPELPSLDELEAEEKDESGKKPSRNETEEDTPPGGEDTPPNGHTDHE
ncbi:MAG: hypothetical protein C0600_14345 [Ignavibacteria bacterium]|nr:MAG: hypothetical protein C0600_14345 [Ignavibacteria bacterium]